MTDLPASNSFDPAVGRPAAAREWPGMRWLAVCFFAVFLAAGVALHGDYGVSWDEEINRDVGRRTYNFVAVRLRGDSASWASVSKGLAAAYGPAFETLLYAGEVGLGLKDWRQTLLMRHFATFLVFWLGVVAFYATLRMRFGDRRIALVGAALLALTPRLFAHSFYNSKDIPMLALFAIGMLTMLRLARRPTVPRAAVHALVCAAAIGIRIVGLLLPAVTLVVVALEYSGRDAHPRRGTRTLAVLAAYGVFGVAFVALFWPALWDDPLGMIRRTLGRVATTAQPANPLALYIGDFVEVSDLPWHYLPVWMAITIPLPTIALFGAGLRASALGLLRESPLAWNNVQTLAYALLFFVPFLAVVLVRPVLYDAWRHLFFVYPAFVAIGVTGLESLWRHRRLQYVMPALVLLALLHGLAMVVVYHPYQNVYFNMLAGRDVESNFELDYWGLSFREGLEYVLRADPSPEVRVSASDYPGVLNSYILEPKDRSRLRFGPVSEADWYLTNHRQPGRYEDFRAGRFPCENQVYAVRRSGATLLGVYKLH